MSGEAVKEAWGPPRLLRVTQAAEWLSVSPRTLQRMLGVELPFIRVRHGVRIRHEAVEAWLAASETKAVSHE